jgi:hypothetical protein
MKKAKLLFVLFFVCSGTFLFAQPVLNAALVESKKKEATNLMKMVEKNFKLPLHDSTYDAYQSAFWALEYLQQKPSYVIPRLVQAVKTFVQLPNDFQGALLQLLYANYPTELAKNLLPLLNSNKISTKRWITIVEYLSRAQPKLSNTLGAKVNTYARELTDTNDVFIEAFKNKYSPANISTNASAICKALSDNIFLPNQNIIVCLHNQNRNYPGIVLVRKANGEWLKFNDTLFYITQLARSTNGLPYYLSNGNTPQGIFKMYGYGISKNTHIGPTENIQIGMPVELSTNLFFNNTTQDSIWTKQLYSTLIPKHLQALPQLYESYYAGSCGRYEIIAHGSTVNPIYYKAQPYKGFTPTMGCLQAKEVWNYTTGERVYSEQQQLTDAFKSLGASEGYLVVLNVINAKRPVNIADARRLVIK